MDRWNLSFRHKKKKTEAFDITCREKRDVVTIKIGNVNILLKNKLST